MQENNFSVLMNLENIGPHYGDKKLSFSESVTSNKTIFYASNGTGKSFISRAFRLCTPSKVNTIADDILTIGKQSGFFSFKIQSHYVDQNMEIQINRGEKPVIRGSFDLLFHVFNNDYVEENIKPKHYIPDGRIEGYILGKALINLTEERKAASELEEEIEKDSKAIDEAINTAKSFLKQNRISPKTTEYLKITRDNVEQGFEYETAGSVDEYIQKIKILEKVPEELSDIQFSIAHVDLAFLDQLESILTTIYPKSDWDEEFVKAYKKHQSFIETGLGLDHADKICPFCKREYDSEALDLINRYNQYKKDKEAQVVAQLRNMLQAIKQIVVNFDEEERKIRRATSQFIAVQEYFPSLTSSKLEQIEQIESYKSMFRNLSEMVSKKIDNLCLELDNIESTINECKRAWELLLKIEQKNLIIVNNANKIKNDMSTERLILRKNLCMAKSIILQNELHDSFKSLNKKKLKLRDIKEEIVRKEQQEKVSKRDKVYETFDFFMNRFFNGKYEIDNRSFQVKFLGSTVGEKASNILSDGEKSIVAFCWYLAETHTIVNNEEDYNKLFFVIDDPISSMDFHFVYAVAQSIRDIKSYFKISEHERIWIFTHNNEFFSILMRNGILANAFLMRPGLITKYDHKLLMPYENHLSDLARIVNGEQKPSHTTGNSIRHIIETIAKFENPKIGLEEYVKSEEMLSKDENVFTLCQDLSHGNIRYQLPYSDDILREAANTVLKFVKARYPGQLKGIT